MKPVKDLRRVESKVAFPQKQPPLAGTNQQYQQPKHVTLRSRPPRSRLGRTGK